MKKLSLLRFAAVLLLVSGLPLISHAAEAVTNGLAPAITDDQHYNRAIHIMAMLLVGFGFLMVFVRKYGRSALTATFLLVSISLPVYMLINKSGIGAHENEVRRLILGEFCAASLLIAAGAVLGRLKMQQYLFLGILFVPAYMLNEWIVLEGGLNLIREGSVVDTGGSIVIHAFGAIFGLGVALTMTTKQEFEKTIESDSVSDRYSMLGSMILWIFWPSFCAALVTPEQMPATVVNVILALCASTIATYILSVSLRRKISIADIANAALAGGVAIGSACANASHTEAVVIGILAGALSTFGFAVIQSRQQKFMKLIDTCGVTNLHGLPGLLGGLAAMPIVKGLDIKQQFFGMIITIVLAFACGLIAGKILPLMGRRTEPYEDAEEFIDAAE